MAGQGPGAPPPAVPPPTPTPVMGIGKGITVSVVVALFVALGEVNRLSGQVLDDQARAWSFTALMGPGALGNVAGWSATFPAYASERATWLGMYVALDVVLIALYGIVVATLAGVAGRRRPGVGPASPGGRRPPRGRLRPRHGPHALGRPRDGHRVPLGREVARRRRRAGGRRLRPAPAGRAGAGLDLVARAVLPAVLDPRGGADRGAHHPRRVRPARPAARRAAPVARRRAGPGPLRGRRRECRGRDHRGAGPRPAPVRGHVAANPGVGRRRGAREPVARPPRAGGDRRGVRRDRDPRRWAAVEHAGARAAAARGVPRRPVAHHRAVRPDPWSARRGRGHDDVVELALRGPAPPRADAGRQTGHRRRRRRPHGRLGRRRRARSGPLVHRGRGARGRGSGRHLGRTALPAARCRAHRPRLAGGPLAQRPGHRRQPRGRRPRQPDLVAEAPRHAHAHGGGAEQPRAPARRPRRGHRPVLPRGGVRGGPRQRGGRHRHVAARAARGHARGRRQRRGRPGPQGARGVLVQGDPAEVAPRHGDPAPHHRLHDRPGQRRRRPRRPGPRNRPRDAGARRQPAHDAAGRRPVAGHDAGLRARGHRPVG